mmetsp:Transcript_16953/g.43377  ORF Transcript_16953/g.43377 Transcript_16953/m.43377 type:complete len:243 (-) Transcript_16953:751-1479(-)
MRPRSARSARPHWRLCSRPLRCAAMRRCYVASCRRAPSGCSSLRCPRNSATRTTRSRRAHSQLPTAQAFLVPSTSCVPRAHTPSSSVRRTTTRRRLCSSSTTMAAVAALRSGRLRLTRNRFRQQRRTRARARRSCCARASSRSPRRCCCGCCAERTRRSLWSADSSRRSRCLTACAHARASNQCGSTAQPQLPTGKSSSRSSTYATSAGMTRALRLRARARVHTASEARASFCSRRAQAASG